MSNALPLPCPDLRPGAPGCPDKRGTLTATVIGSSLAFVLGSIVNVALPQMQAAFDVGATGAQWIVNAYLLPLGALVLMGGALGDHYGRRRVFQAGLLLFALSCLLCAVAWSFPVLLAARALEGVAAAMIAPTSLAIIADAFTGPERGRAVGTWAGIGAAAGALAPVVGGWIVDAAGWRWAFVAVVPFALAAFTIANRSIRESKATAGDRAALDWTGAGLTMLGLLALIWGLIALPAQGATLTVLAALGLGAAIGAAFLAVEARKGGRAMVPLGLFRDRAFSGLNAFTFLLYAALGGLMLLLPYVLIQGLGFSATAAGAAILPFPAILAIASRSAGGPLADRFGPRVMLTAGAGLVALGFALFTQVPATEVSYMTHILPALVVLALGMAASVAPLTSAVLSSAGEDNVGIASGINNALSRIGGLVATALLGLVLLSGDLVAGFALASWAGVALAGVSATLAWSSMRPAPA
ncbi:MAG: MFS transporter [Pseudomonadota bacterium]